ncbi:hypothetical protein ACFP81_06275 [Deinococcus lacus]|uniref:Uncharacterized protein n=1 Tax=Deinococcus lacus TaxID=392561 RepID=A0ABW1YBR4_9DEIO
MGLLALRVATAPVGLLSFLLRAGLVPPTTALAGALPDAVALALGRLFLLLALLSFAAAGLSAFLTQKRLQ